MKKAYGKANLPKSGFRFFFAVAAAFFFMERSLFRKQADNAKGKRLTVKDTGVTATAVSSVSAGGRKFFSGI